VVSGVSGISVAFINLRLRYRPFLPGVKCPSKVSDSGNDQYMPESIWYPSGLVITFYSHGMMHPKSSELILLMVDIETFLFD
jgi:hypothetical protein